MKTINKFFLLSTVALAFMSCSLSGVFSSDAPHAGARFLKSGSIVISRQLDVRQLDDATVMSPLIGYFPPSESFLPANNEAWLEIDSNQKTINVHRGSTLVKTLQAEGDVTLRPGRYSVQVKQKKPVWYAPDQYYLKRQLNVPAQGDRERYLRGALGSFVLYPTTSFPIHCAAIWTEDVGGLRISKTDMSSIYYLLQLGSAVVVK